MLPTDPSNAMLSRSGQRHDGPPVEPQTVLELALHTGDFLSQRLQGCLDRLIGFNERVEGTGSPQAAGASLRKVETGLTVRMDNLMTDFERVTSGIEAQIAALSHFL